MTSEPNYNDIVKRYEPKPEDLARLENNLSYHPPHDGQENKYAYLRAKAFDFGEDLLRHCPPSRELSLALTNLEQAVMWANAAIARNE